MWLTDQILLHGPWNTEHIGREMAVSRAGIMDFPCQSSPAHLIGADTLYISVPLWTGPSLFTFLCKTLDALNMMARWFHYDTNERDYENGKCFSMKIDSKDGIREQRIVCKCQVTLPSSPLLSGCRSLPGSQCWGVIGTTHHRHHGLINSIITRSRKHPTEFSWHQSITT